MWDSSGLMYSYSRTYCDHIGALWLGGLRLDTCQGEEQITDAPNCITDALMETQHIVHE